EVLPEIIQQSLQQFPWPKSMKWGTGEKTWVRPMQNINVIFDGKVIMGSGEFYGHRFLSSKPLKAKSFDDYQKQLRKHHVILSQEEPHEKIYNDANELAENSQLDLITCPLLLDEIVGLVEWPVALLGRFEKE